MAAGRYTIVVDQGSYWSKLFTYLDSEGEAIDLTDYTAEMQIRPFIGSSTVYADLSSDDGITVGGEDGTIFIEMTDDQTAAILEDGIYDIKLTNPAGESERFLNGKVLVNKAVTQ